MLSKDESYMSLLYGEIAVIMDAYNRQRMDELENKLTGGIPNGTRCK